MNEELDLATAVDLADGYAARLRKEAKPFEKVTEVLRAALTAQALLDAAEARLTALGQEEHEQRTRMQTLAIALVLKDTEVQEAQAAAAASLDRLQQQMTEATQAAQEVIRAAEASAAAKRAQLEADYAIRQSELEASYTDRAAQLEVDYQARAAKLRAALEAV